MINYLMEEQVNRSNQSVNGPMNECFVPVSVQGQGALTPRYTVPPCLVLNCTVHAFARETGKGRKAGCSGKEVPATFGDLQYRSDVEARNCVLLHGRNAVKTRRVSHIAPALDQGIETLLSLTG